MKKMIIFLIIISILPACNGIYNLKPAAPTSVAATGADDDEMTRIIISWDSMENAAVYYVYRSDVITGPFEFYGQTASEEFIDNDIDYDTEYYYRVSSGNAWGTYESDLSSVVMGITHEFSWSGTPVTIDTGSSPKLESSFQAVYLYYLDASDNITIRIYDPEEDDPLLQWDDSVSSPGATSNGIYDVVRSVTTYYSVFEDSANSNALTVREYNSMFGMWETIGDLEADISAIPITITSVEKLEIAGINQDIYVSALYNSDSIVILKYNTTFEEWRSVGDPADFSSITSVSELALDSYNGNPSLVYVEGNNTVSAVYYIEETWTDIGDPFSAVAAPASNILYDPSGLYVAYKDFNNVIYVNQYAQGSWDLIDMSSAAFTAGTSTPETMTMTIDSTDSLHLISSTAAGVQHQKWNSGWTDLGFIAASPVSWTSYSAESIEREIYLTYADSGNIYFTEYR